MNHPRVFLALAATLLALGSPALAPGSGLLMGQDSPETALVLPRDTDQLRVLNISRIQQELRVVADSVMPGERPRGESSVELILDPQGRVHEARLIRSSGSTRLDSEAIRIGKLFRFSRYTDPFRPQWVRFEIPIDWMALRR
jgi:TonB family protein